MASIPIDTESRKTGSKARAIVHYRLNANHWDYREETGNDFGRDCTIELSSNDRWNNDKIEAQIKGTNHISKLKLGDGITLSFPIEVKTINYGLGAANAFVLFLVDVNSETVYYLPIQDYFIARKKLFDKLDGNQETLSLHLSMDNELDEHDFELQEIAKSRYVDGPSQRLRKYEVHHKVED